MKIKSVHFEFDNGRVSWFPNKDQDVRPRTSNKPFKWIVSVNGIESWYSNSIPNMSNAKRFLKIDSE